MSNIHILGEKKMRTNIVIDDEIMNKARNLSGKKTKKETIEEALKLLITQLEQAEIRRLRGKLTWGGDLDSMRSDS